MQFSSPENLPEEGNSGKKEPFLKKFENRIILQSHNPTSGNDVSRGCLFSSVHVKSYLGNKLRQKSYLGWLLKAVNCLGIRLRQGKICILKL